MEDDTLTTPSDEEIGASAWSARGVVKALAIGACSLLLGGALGYGVMQRPGSRRSPPGQASAAPAPTRQPLDAAGASLVAPLAPGQRVLDYEVRALEQGDGALVVSLARGADEAQLRIVLADERHAPASFGQYSVMYQMCGSGPVDGMRLATEVAKVLQPHAASPPPPWLRGSR
jgi:hypothetical protein